MRWQNNVIVAATCLFREGWNPAEVSPQNLGLRSFVAESQRRRQQRLKSSQIGRQSLDFSLKMRKIILLLPFRDQKHGRSLILSAYCSRSIVVLTVIAAVVLFRRTPCFFFVGFHFAEPLVVQWFAFLLRYLFARTILLLAAKFL